MAELLDTTLVVAIIGFIILITWSRIMKQRMSDTLTEIRDFLKETFKREDE